MFTPRILPLVFHGALAALALAFAAPAQAQLAYTLNTRGLATLTYNGYSFNGYPTGFGQFAPSYSTAPTFKRPDGTTYAGNAVSTAQSLTSNTVSVTFPWGICTNSYSQSGDKLFMDVTVQNTTADTMTVCALPVALYLQFPATVTTYTGDPGPFYNNCGPAPLSIPRSGDPDTAAPSIRLDFGSGLADFDSEALAGGDFSISVPFAQDGTTARYPLLTINLTHPLAAGATASTRVSLRFAATGTSWTTSSGDVLDRYNAQYPLQLAWNDHRIIGYDILATVDPHPPGNPRGYFNNDNTVDVTTPAGQAAFRTKLLARADAIISVLQAANAQGFVCWNIEGAEVGNATYYGDPSYVVNIPEMMYTDASGVKTCDAFFQKIAAAGFRVGNCLRPQDLTVIGGVLNQCDSPDPAQTLINKVNYAANRWGSSLFYVDSTSFENWPTGNPYGYIAKSGGSIAADYFKRVQETCPDAVLFPENQYGRYYAYSAGFDSYAHHDVKRTHPMVRDQWPGAFSTIMFNGIKNQADVPNLVDGVKHGDILMVPCWYNNVGVTDAINIYGQAGTLPSISLTSPPNGAVIPAGATLTLTANATAPSGATITKLEFFRGDTTTGSTKIGESTTAPFQLAWSSVPAGSYSLTAKATCSNGLTQSSAAVQVTIKTGLAFFVPGSISGGTRRGSGGSNGPRFSIGSGGGSRTLLGLGIYDTGNAVTGGGVGPVGDGLNNSHAVGLYSDAGSLLVQATVAAGNAAPILDGFRYATALRDGSGNPITSFTLQAGNTYRLVYGLTASPTGDYYLDSPSFTLNSGYTFGGGRYAPVGNNSATAFPPYSAGSNYVGPTFFYTTP